MLRTRSCFRRLLTAADDKLLTQGILLQSRFAFLFPRTHCLRLVALLVQILLQSEFAFFFPRTCQRLVIDCCYIKQFEFSFRALLSAGWWRIADKVGSRYSQASLSSLFHRLYPAFEEYAR